MQKNIFKILYFFDLACSTVFTLIFLFGVNILAISSVILQFIETGHVVKTGSLTSSIIIIGFFSVYQTIAQLLWLGISRFYKSLVLSVNLRYQYVLFSALILLSLYPLLIIYGGAILWMPALAFQLWSNVYLYIQLYDAQVNYGLFKRFFKFYCIKPSQLVFIFLACFVLGLSITHFVAGNSWLEYRKF